MRSAFGCALLLLLPLAVQAQSQAQAPPGPRTATVLAGFGNDLGWFGLQGEKYFAGDRLSAFGGIGHTPSVDDGDPSGLTVAAGVRGFTPGNTHRGFLELSVSQVAVESGPGGARLYGPGVQAGWQYVSRGGFTVLASLGLGFASSDLVGESNVHGLVNLGFGYTWRRR